MRKKLTSFKERSSWLDAPSEAAMASKLPRCYLICLSINGEITDSHNLFESSYVVGTCLL